MSKFKKIFLFFVILFTLFIRNSYSEIVNKIEVSGNDRVSKEVINHSYEDMKFKEKTNRSGNNLRYFLKYKILFKTYTLFLFLVNLIKKIVLLRF